MRIVLVKFVGFLWNLYVTEMTIPKVPHPLPQRTKEQVGLLTCIQNMQLSIINNNFNLLDIVDGEAKERVEHPMATTLNIPTSGPNREPHATHNNVIGWL